MAGLGVGHGPGESIAYNLFNRSNSADCISVNASLAAPPIYIAIKRTEQAEPLEDLMKELLAVIAENTTMIILRWRW